MYTCSFFVYICGNKTGKMGAKFQLKKTSKGGVIYVAVTLNHKRERFATGIAIDPRHWSNGEPKKGQTLIRERLNTIRKDVDLYLLTDEVTPLGLKRVIDKSLGKVGELNFNGLIDLYLEFKKTDVTARTLEKLTPQIKDFKAFKKGKELKDLTPQFYQSYTSSLVKKGLQPASVNTYIKNIKAFLNWLIENKYASIDIKSGFKSVEESDKDIIALTESELHQLQHPTAKDGTPIELTDKQERTRDLFVFGCLTGLRFADLQAVTSDLITDEVLTIKQGKTGNIVQIPLLQDAQQILDKYNGQLPQISNQKANKNLKELFTVLGLTRKVYTLKGVEPLNKAVTFHVSRKSFITIALTRGMHAKIVQSISGHRKDEVFNQYIAFSTPALKQEMQKMKRGQLIQMKVV